MYILLVLRFSAVFRLVQNFQNNQSTSTDENENGVGNSTSANNAETNDSMASAENAETDESDADMTPNEHGDAQDETVIDSPVDNRRNDPSYYGRGVDEGASRVVTRSFNPLGVFNSHISFIAIPRTVKEALNSPESREWKEAMEREMASLIKNKTWEIVELPNDAKTVKCKWVFSTKTDELGNILRFKARLVARGFTQEYGIDYNETFSPVVKYTTIRFVLAIAAARNLKITQMDAVTAYL